MINGLRHEDACNALEALALDALDASERAAVMAHVAECSVCQRELAALENAAAQLTFAVRPVPMSDIARDRVKSRLMKRVSGGRSEAPRDVEAIKGFIPRHPPTGELEAPGEKPFHILVPGRIHVSARGAWWLAAAASLVAAVSLASLSRVTRERDTLKTAFQEVSLEKSGSRAAADSLRATLAARDRVIANLTGPNVAVMTLASTGPNAPSARMFWNQAANAWTLVAHRLPKPLPGRTYQLWFVTTKQKISAGTFTSSASGDAMMQATYALPKDAQLAALAVTDEPEAGSAQPTTTPVLLALAR